MAIEPKLIQDLVVGKLYFVVGISAGKIVVEPPFQVAALPAQQKHKRPLRIRYRKFKNVAYPERYVNGYLIAQTIGLVETADLPKAFTESFLRTIAFTKTAYAFYLAIAEDQQFPTLHEITGIPRPT